MGPMRLAAGGLAAVVLAAGVAWAYDEQGHFRATEVATAALPAEMPAFFRNGAVDMASTSMDPDFFRIKSLPQLKEAEDPEHYIDLELLKGQALPAGRYQYVSLCAKEGLNPAKVGVLPYALAEWTQRLTMALAEYRRWPDNPRHQQRCLVYAGILAHYAQDATMPLHTTIHYDGRVGPEGKSPRSGIHAKVDALIHKVAVDPGKLGATLKVAPLESLWPGILEQLQRSHALVDKVYALEDQLPDRPAALPADSKAAEFAKDRLAAAAQFTAVLYLTAWRDSAKIELPEWYIRQREATEGAKRQTWRRGDTETRRRGETATATTTAAICRSRRLHRVNNDRAPRRARRPRRETTTARSPQRTLRTQRKARVTATATTTTTLTAKRRKGRKNNNDNGHNYGSHRLTQIDADEQRQRPQQHTLKSGRLRLSATNRAACGQT